MKYSKAPCLSVVVCGSALIVLYQGFQSPNLGCRHPLGVSDANLGGVRLNNGAAV